MSEPIKDTKKEVEEPKTESNGVKDPNSKTYFMTKEEQDFLVVRTRKINENNIVSGDLKFVMDSFVFNSILARLGIVGEEIKKYEVDYNALQGTLVLKRLPQETKIVIPGFIPPKDIEKTN